MTLKIISADAVLYSGEVDSVTLPGVMGEFTVLRKHASLLAALAAGIPPPAEQSSRLPSLVA